MADEDWKGKLDLTVNNKYNDRSPELGAKYTVPLSSDSSVSVRGRYQAYGADKPDMGISLGYTKRF